MANVDALSLSSEEAADVRITADDLLDELGKDQPDRGLARRGVATIRGLLT